MRSYNLFNPLNNTDVNKIIFDSYGFPTFTAYLKEPLSIQTDAQWGTLFDVDSRLGIVGDAGKLMGLNIGKAGILTKQFYNGGSYTKISGTCRMVDFDGSGMPLKNAINLLACASPTKATKGDNLVQQVLDIIRNAKQTDSTENSKKPEDQKETENDLVSIITRTVAYITKNFSVSKIIDALVEGEPDTVSISTAYTTFDNMIVKSVEFVPSKELLRDNKQNLYPLFVDVTFTFESRQIYTGNQLKGKISPKIEVN